ncbi:MAG: J domain-containing protein, partial [Vibrionaceae bacterium]
SESNIDQPSLSQSIAEAETVTSRGAEVSPEQQQLTQKCYQKLRKAYQLNGPLTELGRITLLQAPNSVQIDSDRALLMLNYGIALLTRLSGYMPYLPQEDVKLAATIRITFALVLNAKMLREMSAAASKSPSSATPPPTLPPMSSSARYLHYYTICAYLKHRTQPWNVDALYQDVTELLRHFEPKESEQSQVTNVPLTTFMLDDVPLNPEIELPASYSRAALGASSTQSPEELLAIYKERCLRYHPDQHPHQKELAQKRFLRLQIVGASLKLKL